MRGWLLDRGRAGAGAQGSILAEGILWFPATTLEAIAEEIGASRMTVRRDIKDLKGRGVIVNKRRFRGVQLGLVVGKVSVQNEHLQPDSKCSERTLTQPLLSSSSSCTNSFIDNLTKGSGIDRGSGGKKRRTRSRKPAVLFEDLAFMADGPAGWEKLAAVPQNGVGLCLEEKTGIGIARILSIWTSLEKDTLWPCVAIIRAVKNWTGKDQGGRPLQDPGGWLRRTAYFIATEDLRREWVSYQEERDKRMAEARGPEAVQAQALIDALAGKMQMPGSRLKAEGC